MAALGARTALRGKALRRQSSAPRPAARAAAGGTPARACGIIGVYTRKNRVATELYEGLLMLQHRGQDSAGIVAYDGESFRERKSSGLVKDVFSKKEMDFLDGNVGIGHVRYPTAGGLSSADAQPFFVNSPLGIYLIHNGNLTNTDELRVSLHTQDDLSYFRHLRTASDSEVLLNIFADEIHRAHKMDPTAPARELVFSGVRATMNQVRGAYSIITLVDRVGMFAFRDPNGIRPLVLGHRKSEDGEDEWAFASEDCAFGPIGFTRVRDIQPGEAVLVTLDGKLITQQVHTGELHPCIFEYIYLARPDSTLNGVPVYDFQLACGRRLAKRIQEERDWNIDTVVPVPDGSRPAAIEIAAAMNKPYREGLVKNRYVGRTFIMPNQRLREMSVRRKLNAMSAVFRGRDVLLVDDSIVRGTTMRQIVEMVRRAGARKVYLASASPPVRYPNVYGVDMPNRKEFVANGLTEEQICQELGADGLIYQSLEDLVQSGHELNPHIKTFDTSCFDCSYVTGDVDDAYLENLESGGRGKGREVKSGKTPVAA